MGIVSCLNPYNGSSNNRKQICASLPPTKKFFSRYVPKLLGSSILNLERVGTTKPTRSSGTDGIYDTQRGRSEDGLVTGQVDELC